MTRKKDEKNSMQVRDYEANTVEAAIRCALNELGIPKEKIKIKILAEGQRGLFGMEGVKKAKIRVTILSNEKKSE